MNTDNVNRRELCEAVFTRGFTAVAVVAKVPRLRALHRGWFAVAEVHRGLALAGYYAGVLGRQFQV